MIYWDTSALAALLLQDRGYQLIEAWIASQTATNILSNFTWGEFVSSAGMRVRSGRLDAAGGHQTLALAEAFVADWPKEMLSSEDIQSATALVAQFDLRLRLPDAIHIAIAKRARAMLITTDHAQRDAARAVGLSVHDPLEDYA